MIVRKYGIELHRLTEADIELVRTHRNSEVIQSKMFFQEEISEEAQKEWFKRIDNHYNYYFIIHYKDTKVGLIHGEILSFEERTARGGIFIWDEHVYHTHVPILASICMADMTFVLFDMKETYAEVRRDNTVALLYNKKLGYEVLQDDEEQHDKVKMVLTKAAYLNQAISIRERIRKVTKEATDLTWDDIEFPPSAEQSHLYKDLPEHLKSHLLKHR